MCGMVSGGSAVTGFADAHTTGPFGNKPSGCTVLVSSDVADKGTTCTTDSSPALKDVDGATMISLTEDSDL